MRLVVIDPQARAIEEAHSDGSRGSIRVLMQIANAHALDSSRIAEFDDSFDYCWVDDSGLRGGPVHAFQFDICKYPFAGRAVLIGADKRSGRNCNAKLSLAFLRRHVRFLGRIQPHVQWNYRRNANHVLFAEMSWEYLE
jgi:hypothetical protein